jgi:hypothetical protein
MSAGSLDKELAASGFTSKEQVEMEKVGQMFVQTHVYVYSLYSSLVF